MEYMHLVYIHLATIIPAIFIGTYLLASRKGSSSHKALGKVYMVLMLITAIVTIVLPAHVGPSFLGHFGFIHLLSILTVFSVSGAYFAVKKGDMRTHKGNMILLYFGGIILAGSFAFEPGRLLHTWLFT
ncbi:MAG: DUF2306 domain-containing protein [Gammaproteobacteria bacterium]|jgi:uncharacterized membrane protein|nr:DUF2306 domain-containing protein [Gammaproteobacteria bacterium]